MSERDEFEAFCKSRGWANPSASEWACWQAATARERERCLLVVAKWTPHHGICLTVADDIRKANP